MSLQLRHRGLRRCWRWLIAWASWAGFIAAATGELEISVSSLCPSDCVSVSPPAGLQRSSSDFILNYPWSGEEFVKYKNERAQTAPCKIKTNERKKELDILHRQFWIKELKGVEMSLEMWAINRAENERRERELVPGRVYELHLKCNLSSC